MVRGKLRWSVVKNRRVGGKIRPVTIQTLGHHPDMESARKAWDALRGPYFGPDGLSDAGFRFFADQEPTPPRPLPSCFAVLGLNRVSTEQEVKAAYRSKILDAHPDRGGRHDKAVALNRAYEEALEWIGPA
jgi:hypothetical protein